MKSMLAVGLGGALGAVCRYALSLLMRGISSGFPLGTLTANLAGCLVIGLAAGFMSTTAQCSPNIRLFLITGFCGALTTMSSFIYELDRLFHESGSFMAVVYAGLTLAGSFLFFALGMAVVSFALRS